MSGHFLGRISGTKKEPIKNFESFSQVFLYSTVVEKHNKGIAKIVNLDLVEHIKKFIYRGLDSTRLVILFENHLKMSHFTTLRAKRALKGAILRDLFAKKVEFW